MGVCVRFMGEVGGEERSGLKSRSCSIVLTRPPPPGCKAISAADTRSTFCLFPPLESTGQGQGSGVRADIKSRERETVAGAEGTVEEGLSQERASILLSFVFFLTGRGVYRRTIKMLVLTPTRLTPECLMHRNTLRRTQPPAGGAALETVIHDRNT